MDYFFSKVLNLPFEDALEAVREAGKSEGFGVLTEIDVKATLKMKLDTDFRNYTILGFCNPPTAYKALQMEDKLGLLLPCNAVVQELDDGRVEVSVIDPLAMMLAVDNAELADIGLEVRDKLKKVLENL